MDHALFLKIFCMKAALPRQRILRATKLPNNNKNNLPNLRNCPGFLITRALV